MRHHDNFHEIDDYPACIHLFAVLFPLFSLCWFRLTFDANSYVMVRTDYCWISHYVVIWMIALMCVKGARTLLSKLVFVRLASSSRTITPNMMPFASSFFPVTRYSRWLMRRNAKVCFLIIIREANHDTQPIFLTYLSSWFCRNDGIIFHTF